MSTTFWMNLLSVYHILGFLLALLFFGAVAEIHGPKLSELMKRDLLLMCIICLLWPVAMLVALLGLLVHTFVYSPIKALIGWIRRK